MESATVPQPARRPPAGFSHFQAAVVELPGGRKKARIRSTTEFRPLLWLENLGIILSLWQLLAEEREKCSNYIADVVHRAVQSSTYPYPGLQAAQYGILADLLADKKCGMVHHAQPDEQRVIIRVSRLLRCAAGGKIPAKRKLDAAFSAVGKAYTASFGKPIFQVVLFCLGLRPVQALEHAARLARKQSVAAEVQLYEMLTASLLQHLEAAAEQKKRERKSPARRKK